MPFRCKCGRTFEKTDTFASHTSSCAPFHSRRMSDTSHTSTTINTSLFSMGFFSSQTSSPTDSSMPSMDKELSRSVPTSTFFMPTALSIQNAFEGARRRSMSYGSSSTK